MDFRSLHPNIFLTFRFSNPNRREGGTAHGGVAELARRDDDDPRRAGEGISVARSTNAGARHRRGSVVRAVFGHLPFAPRSSAMSGDERPPPAAGTAAAPHERRTSSRCPPRARPCWARPPREGEARREGRRVRGEARARPITSMAADDEDADHRDDDRDRDRDRDRDASGRISHPSKRRFRGHVAETPSHPGGVNEDVRRDISDRRREHRDRRVSARSGDRDDRRGDDRRGDDRRGDDRRDDRRRRRDGSRDRTRDGKPRSNPRRKRARGRIRRRRVGRGFRRIRPRRRNHRPRRRNHRPRRRNHRPRRRTHPRRDVAGMEAIPRAAAPRRTTPRVTPRVPTGNGRRRPTPRAEAETEARRRGRIVPERVGDDAFPSTARAGVARRPGRPRASGGGARRIARNSRSRAPPSAPLRGVPTRGCAAGPVRRGRRRMPTSGFVRCPAAATGAARVSVRARGRARSRPGVVRRRRGGRGARGRVRRLRRRRGRRANAKARGGVSETFDASRR